MKMRKIACTLAAAAFLTAGAAGAAQAADIPEGWDRYGVYATDAECQDTADGLIADGKIEGYECYAEGRSWALDVNFK